MDYSDLIIKEKQLAGKHTDLILDIGSLLLASGAHCERINRNLKRIGETWRYDVDILYDLNGLVITIQSKNDPAIYATRHKRVVKHHVNFTVLNYISLLSWQVKEESLNPDEVEELFSEIKSTSAYPRWFIILGVALACAALCLVSKGNWIDGGIAFMAGGAGIFVRQEIEKRGFFSSVAIIVAAFTTTLIAGLDQYYHLGSTPESALATSVLYLVPGVPLINSVIDLIEGYTNMALARGLLGGFLLLCIAVGMSLAIFFLGFHNF
ncbi:MAG: threonine/serine exporter family protein [Sphingobacteriales bacterium]|jgi:uncharacterized membrane protein YjjP (DUF1212 family)|nr:threonine/serine exporter family protein [Sphingobacteriales bacterium]